MRVLLTIDGPDGRLRRLLAPGTYRLGRDPACEVVLTDPDVGRRHLEIVIPSKGIVEILDSGSANGTWRGRRRIARIRPLLGKCDLHLGSRRTRLRMACHPLRTFVLTAYVGALLALSGISVAMLAYRTSTGVPAEIDHTSIARELRVRRALAAGDAPRAQRLHLAPTEARR